MYRFYVTSNQQLTPTTLLLTLKKAPSDKPFSFQPGQYANIKFKVNGRPTPARNFSIVNSATDQGILQFSVKIQGRFTNALTGLTVGDEVKVRGPFGNFIFDAKRDKDTVMIAGGIGITPFISMVQYATALGLQNNINLIYSARNQDDVPFIEKLMSLEKENPHFRTTLAISDGPTDKFVGKNIESGRVTPGIIDQVVGDNYDSKTYFICGSPEFMKAMIEILKAKGVADEKIITEAFGQVGGGKAGKLFSWPFGVYALGAVGVAAASVIIMVNDLISALPALSKPTQSSSVTNTTPATNSRQDDLDGLINNSTTPTTTTTTPATTQHVPVCTTTQSGVTTCV